MTDLCMKNPFYSFAFFLFMAIPFLAHSQKEESLSAQHYVTFTENGAWCWFSDPRALYLNGKVYSGWVASDGSVMVGSYDEVSGETIEVNLSPQFNKDDHANPSFLALPDNRLMVFFSAHSTRGRGEKEPGINYYISKNPEDITEWQSPNRISQNAEGPMGFCYTNPVLLSEENNRIYVFWRGGDWKPTFSYSDDRGETWSKVFSLIKSSQFTSKRPYMKISSNGKDEIHFAFTDGHPRNEPLNSIYYLKYKAGKFYKADGTLLGGLNDLPLEHEDCDVVYDANEAFKNTAFGVRSWIWDVAVGKDGNPALVYTKLPTESEHRYWYAHWDGDGWKSHLIENAGSWFPRYDKNKETREPEPHYSGGVVLDHEDVSKVYYSKPVNDIFEIYESRLNGDGQWSESEITTNSKKDNVRPVAILGAENETQSQVQWMYNDHHYTTYENFDTKIKLNLKQTSPSGKLNKSTVKAAMKTVADWQLKEPLVHHLGDWTNAALYAGMVEWAKLSGDSIYFDYLRDKGDKIQWSRLLRTNPDFRYHADDYATGQMFVEMYRIFKEEKMIKSTGQYFDFMLKYPSKRSLKFTWDPGSFPTERWSWCDALFMAPTVWAKMAKLQNREDYRTFMHQEFKYTYDYLYDTKEHLFFRDDRYFDQKEANGAKVFWGRGNGWVIAGLPKIIEELPKDWENRKFYEKLYVEMAKKIASLQDEEGYWRASLLDPASYPNPETSSTGFFTYALAWGVNNGYLSKKKFQPLVLKSWQALVKAVYPDGKLGWVQPVGQDPKEVTQDMTEVYGVGAFLLAGTEVMKMMD